MSCAAGLIPMLGCCRTTGPGVTNSMYAFASHSKVGFVHDTIFDIPLVSSQIFRTVTKSESGNFSNHAAFPDPGSYTHITAVSRRRRSGPTNAFTTSDYTATSSDFLSLLASIGSNANHVEGFLSGANAALFIPNMAAMIAQLVGGPGDFVYINDTFTDTGMTLDYGLNFPSGFYTIHMEITFNDPYSEDELEDDLLALLDVADLSGLSAGLPATSIARFFNPVVFDTNGLASFDGGFADRAFSVAGPTLSPYQVGIYRTDDGGGFPSHFPIATGFSFPNRNDLPLIKKFFDAGLSRNRLTNTGGPGLNGLRYAQADNLGMKCGFKGDFQRCQRVYPDYLADTLLPQNGTTITNTGLMLIGPAKGGNGVYNTPFAAC